MFNICIFNILCKPFKTINRYILLSSMLKINNLITQKLFVQISNLMNQNFQKIHGHNKQQITVKIAILS